ncbi:MAG: AMP-binding protein [Sneathiellales bacterium]|nr:AMP-binding protein [Sneathiellales bacterium]
MKTIPQLIKNKAENIGSKPAIIDRGQSTSYQDLYGRSQSLAVGLASLGLKKGECVGLWMPNITAYIEAFLACASLGLIVVSVNTKFKSHEVSDIVSRSGCKALILWPDFKNIPFLEILNEIGKDDLKSLDNIVLYREEETELVLPPCVKDKTVTLLSDLYLPVREECPDINPEDGVVIYTTSGTTGKPKFVLHSHFSMVQHAIEVANDFGWSKPDTKLLQALPLCGTFGLTQAISGIAAGAEVYCMAVFDPAIAATLIQENQITCMNGSDDMYAMLLAQSEQSVPYPSLTSAGFAAFNPALEDIVEKAEARGIKLYGLWGMSEVQAFVGHQDVDMPAGLRKRAGGRLISPTAEVRVRDPESGILLGNGENGEIEIKTVSQMKEYFLNPEATAKTLTEDGFIKTGDLGFLDGEGRFVFLSRMGDVLRLGGYLTDPVEIENAIQDVVGVEKAQVVGVETDRGAKAFAFVIGSAAPADILIHCQQTLAGYKLPIHMEMVDTFPMTESANGLKIQRAKLRQMAQEIWNKRQ